MTKIILSFSQLPFLFTPVVFWYDNIYLLCFPLKKKNYKKKSEFSRMWVSISSHKPWGSDKPEFLHTKYKSMYRCNMLTMQLWLLRVHVFLQTVLSVHLTKIKYPLTKWSPNLSTTVNTCSLFCVSKSNTTVYDWHTDHCMTSLFPRTNKTNCFQVTAKG